MANQYNYPPIADSRALYKRMKHHEARLYGLHFQRAHEPVLAAALEAELEARWPETGFKDVSEGGLSSRLFFDQSSSAGNWARVTGVGRLDELLSCSGALPVR